MPLSTIKKKIRPNDRIIMASKEITNLRSTPAQKIGSKPKGLWYGIGNSWIEWVESSMPEWRGDFIYKIEVNPSRLLQLKSRKDIDNFTETYGAYGIAASIGGEKMIDIDWRKVATKYSGIEIAPYQWSARHDYMWYYGWDVASGCIWNKSLVKSVKRVTI